MGACDMNPLKLTCLECGQVNRVPETKLGAKPKCGTCGAMLMPDRPVDVDPRILDRAARMDDVPLVVDFWAPWCGPCRMMAPEFGKAASLLAGTARLVKLNTQDHPETGAAHSVRGIPTLVQFANGRERKRQSGALPAKAIADWART
jgi:thioredoxin 2